MNINDTKIDSPLTSEIQLNQDLTDLQEISSKLPINTSKLRQIFKQILEDYNQNKTLQQIITDGIPRKTLGSTVIDAEYFELLAENISTYFEHNGESNSKFLLNTLACYYAILFNKFK